MVAVIDSHTYCHIQGKSRSKSHAYTQCETGACQLENLLWYEWATLDHCHQCLCLQQHLQSSSSFAVYVTCILPRMLFQSGKISPCLQEAPPKPEMSQLWHYAQASIHTLWTLGRAPPGRLSAVVFQGRASPIFSSHIFMGTTALAWQASCCTSAMLEAET